MGSSAIQLTGTALVTIGTLLSVFAILNNSWAKSDVSGQVIENMQRSWGLWMRCQHVSAGLNTCDHYDRLILGSPTELILSRAFMCLGLLFGILSILLSLVGADCATLVQGASKKKKTRCTAGVLGLSAGGLVLVTGILIAVIVVKDYHAQNYFVTMQQGGIRGRRADDGAALNPESLLDHIQVANCDSDGNCEAVKEKGVRFNSMRSGGDGMGMVFGAGVMLAWGAGIILLVGGGLLLSQGCGGSTYEEEHEYNQGTNYNQGNPYQTHQSQPKDYL